VKLDFLNIPNLEPLGAVDVTAEVITQACKYHPIPKPVGAYLWQLV